MCEGSIHVAHRKATDAEDLVVREIPNHGISGYYPADPKAGDKRLVCVVNVKEAVIDKIEFKQNIMPHIRNTPMARLQGLTNLKVSLLHYNYQDVVRAEVNGYKVEIPLTYLVNGTRVRIPPTVVGVDAVNKAIDEVVKTEAGPVRRALSMTANAIRKRAARAKAKAE